LQRTSRHPGSAFTLVEAVVALAVVALALGWLVSAGQHAAEATAVAAARARSAALAAGMAVRMQSGALRPVAGRGTFPEAPGFEWHLAVGPAAGAVGCREASLAVIYPGMGSQPEEVRFVFLLAEG
jgi:general secretion pathway protein I